MAIEERGRVVSGCQDVPRSNRIMLVNQTLNTETYATHVQFRHTPWNDLAPLEEEMIYWKADHVSDEIFTPEMTTEKILRVAGYAGNLLSCRIIRCRCPDGAFDACTPTTSHGGLSSSNTFPPNET